MALTRRHSVVAVSAAGVIILALLVMYRFTGSMYGSTTDDVTRHYYYADPKYQPPEGYGLTWSTQDGQVKRTCFNAFGNTSDGLCAASPVEPTQQTCESLGAEFMPEVQQLTGRRPVFETNALGCVFAFERRFQRSFDCTAYNSTTDDDLFCICAKPRTIPPRCRKPFPASMLAKPPNSTNHPLPNIIVISLDTARADTFPFNNAMHGDDLLNADCKNDSQPLCGVWSRLVNRSHPAIIFRNAFQAAPWTRPSHAAMLTGFPTAATGILDSDHRLKVPLIAAHLGGAYQRIAKVDNMNLMPDVDMRPDRAAGHHTDFNWKPFSFGWTNGGWDDYVMDSDSIRNAIKVLQAARLSSRPLFLFAHTNIVHTSNGWGTSYMGKVITVDAWLRDMFAAVQWDNTIVVLTSDHGEGLEPPRIWHGGRMNQDLMRANLIVWLPPKLRERLGAAATKAPTVIHTPVASIDLVPSLLFWAGYEPPTPSFFPGQILPVSDPPLNRSVIPAAFQEVLDGAGRKMGVARLLVGDDPVFAVWDPSDVGQIGGVISFLEYGLNPDTYGRILIKEAISRMAIRYPMKHAVTRFNNGTSYHNKAVFVYNLAYDPDERVNLALPWSGSLRNFIWVRIPWSMSSETVSAVLRAGVLASGPSAVLSHQWGTMIVPADSTGCVRTMASVLQRSVNASARAVLVDADVRLPDGFFRFLSAALQSAPSDHCDVIAFAGATDDLLPVGHFRDGTVGYVRRDRDGTDIYADYTPASHILGEHEQTWHSAAPGRKRQQQTRRLWDPPSLISTAILHFPFPHRLNNDTIAALLCAKPAIADLPRLVRIPPELQHRVCFVDSYFEL